MNTNNAGPDSTNDPATQNAQDEQEPCPPDAEEASGGVDGNDEPVVDMPDQDGLNLQEAMEKLFEAGAVLFKHLMAKKAQHTCGNCDCDEEPANIAYGAAFYDENGQGCGSMGEYIPTSHYDVQETLFGERAAEKRHEAGRHGFSMGLGLGSAVATMGVNALIQELIWGVGEMSADLGGVVRSAFGRRPVQAGGLRVVRHPRRIKWPPMPTSGDYDVMRMPTPESWGSFCRGSAPEASMSEASDPAPDQNEFMRKLMDLGEKIKSGTEQHEEVADVFKHFEELFGEFFPKP
jgi:hypothetical protein